MNTLACICLLATCHLGAAGEAPVTDGLVVDLDASEPFNKTEFWAPTVWAYQRMALFGQMPESYDQILHKNDVFLAGWRSVLENDGRPVNLDEVPLDWETPIKIPGHPDNGFVDQFHEKFG